MKIKESGCLELVQGWELERIMFIQPRAEARTLQWSLVPGGRGIPWGMITYIWLEIGFRAEQSSKPQLMGLEKGAARRNITEKYFGLAEGKGTLPEFQCSNWIQGKDKPRNDIFRGII